MTQNFLYMYEFVVNDLIITRPNICAPEEYPTCCELTFRSHVYVSICDEEFGGCINVASKSGKYCLFSLETPIKKDDRLHVHVFKKRTDNCKFLLGATQIPVNKMFDKVTNDFLVKNSDWDAHVNERNNNNYKKNNEKVVIDNFGADTSTSRREKLSPTYELNKKLLSLSNISGLQTGNIVLIIRLTCMGPTIVSPFPLRGEDVLPVNPRLTVLGKKNEVQNTVTCQRYFSSNFGKDYLCCSRENYDRVKERECKLYNLKQLSKECESCNRRNSSPRGCPCSSCNEEYQKDENEKEEKISQNIDKLFTTSPSKPELRAQKYDEFEANLNGSGLIIRVLKDTHIVEDICNINSNNLPESSSLCKIGTKNCTHNSIKDLIKGETMNSNKNQPVYSGKIKYPENDFSYGDNFNIPVFNKLSFRNGLNEFRKASDETRNCCFQVQPHDIDSTLRAINATAKKKGIEVCYKTCEDPDTDTFLIRLGKKNAGENKKDSIEIELRTPKEPIRICAWKCTKETQIEDSHLNVFANKKKGRKGMKK